MYIQVFIYCKMAGLISGIFLETCLPFLCLVKIHTQYLLADSLIVGTVGFVGNDRNMELS